MAARGKRAVKAVSSLASCMSCTLQNQDLELLLVHMFEHLHIGARWEHDGGKQLLDPATQRQHETGTTVQPWHEQREIDRKVVPVHVPVPKTRASRCLRHRGLKCLGVTGMKGTGTQTHTRPTWRAHGQTGERLRRDMSGLDSCKI